MKCHVGIPWRVTGYKELRLRLTDEQHAILMAAARENGDSANSLIRRFIAVLEVPAGLERTPQEILENVRKVWRETR